MSSAALSIGSVWDGSFGEVASGGLPGTFRLSKSPASKMAAAPNEKIRFMVVGFVELNFMSLCRVYEVHSAWCALWIAPFRRCSCDFGLVEEASQTEAVYEIP